MSLPMELVQRETRGKPIVLILLFGVLFLSFACEKMESVTKQKNCEPTLYDEIGPFYRPNAPVRSKVGNGGYLLRGKVLSTEKCRPLGNAMLEFWLVNVDGQYDDSHRATVFSDTLGNYSFESNIPSDYVGRLPHIHLRVSAQGFEELITQHYPEKGTVSSDFTIVLPPASKK